jgi:hypothetical protein
MHCKNIKIDFILKIPVLYAKLIYFEANCSEIGLTFTASAAKA